MQNTEEDKFIGHKLKLKRIQLGLSQKQLAFAERLSFQQIQKYERGENRISATTLYRFSKLLDMPITYFFEGIEKHSKQINHYINLVNKEIILDLKTLTRTFSKIKNKVSRKTLISLAKSLLNDEKTKTFEEEELC